MQIGYIKLWRQIQDTELWRERRVFSKNEAWIDLLLSTNWIDGQALLGNKLIHCKRGQSVKSLGTWAKRWGWKSKHKVSTFLKLLKNMGQIETENVSVTVRITICNYDRYQEQGNGLGTERESLGNESGTDRELIEEVKEVKEVYINNTDPHNVDNSKKPSASPVSPSAVIDKKAKIALIIPKYESQPVEGSFWQQIVNKCGGDQFTAGKIFYRAVNNNAVNLKAWIVEGIKPNGYAWNSCKDEYDDPGSVKDWVESVCFKQGPQHISSILGFHARGGGNP